MRVVIWTAVSSARQATDDKISLDEQERAGREWAAAGGHEVVAVLTIPGESRSESDVITIFEDFAAKGIFAYHDLRRMWQEPRAFDVLFCYHESRLARSDSLFAYVVANVMRSGAKIFSHLGGWYEPNDYKLKMAIGMINVSSEMERLQAVGWAAKEAKAPKGEMVHGLPPFGYTVLRNEKGRTIRLVVDETQRPSIEAAARLLLEGVSWFRLEQELYARYGYTKDGKPFQRWFFYRLFYNPVFWGHAARGRLARYKSNKQVIHAREQLWVLDRHVSPPDGVRVWYDVNEPFLDPNLGEQLRQELLRRRDVVRGRAHTKSLKRFSGLLVCFYCGFAFAYGEVGKQHLPVYRCRSKWTAATDCLQPHIMEKTVQEWFDAQLRRMLASADSQMFRRQDEPMDQMRREMTLRTALDELNQRLERGIEEQLSTADPRIRERFRQRLAEMSAQREALERELELVVSQNTGAQHNSDGAYRTLLEYSSLDQFWAADSNLINRVLYGLLGDNVLVIKDKQIVGFAKRRRAKIVRRRSTQD